MYKRLFMAGVAAAMCGSALGQDMPLRMTRVGGGGPDWGKCTVEVVVDGNAEIEMNGDTAVLRNLGGAPPQWRRFECTGTVPRNPADLRFAGLQGRGRQRLVGDPRSGGAVVVRIDDPSGGPGGYTFDITWGDPRGNWRNPQGTPQGSPQAYPQPSPQGYPQGSPQGYPQPPAPPPYPDRGNDRGYDQRADRGPENNGPGNGRDEDAYHRDRGDAFQGDDWRRHIFGRVRADLDHVQSETFPSGGDQYRLARARRELDQLQNLQARGRWDRRELDDVVNALGRVVADNRMSPRDREILNDDLRRLRDFRAHVSDYGVR